MVGLRWLRRVVTSPRTWADLAFVVETSLECFLLTFPAALIVAPAAAAAAAARDRTGAWGAVLTAALLGPALALLVLPALSAPVVRFDAWRAELHTGEPLPRPAAPTSAGAWVRSRYRAAQGWRESIYAVVAFLLGWTATMILLMLLAAAVILLAAPLLVREGVPITFGGLVVRSQPGAWLATLVGAALIPLTVLTWRVLSRAHLALLRMLVAADVDPDLVARLVEVRRSRARLVDAFDAERRRIERDLHDGAQQRLVALTMQVGLGKLEAQRALGPDHEATRAIARAHDQAKEFMTDLRSFIHGIHPKVLSDVGLDAALDQLASAAPIPVSVRVDTAGRLARHLESTLYFALAEALTNVIRHADATHASVWVRSEADTLVAEVADDGRGGADAAAGTGLTGIADRLAVVDGRLSISSPPGGPTRLVLTIPDGAP